MLAQMHPGHLVSLLPLLLPMLVLLLQAASVLSNPATHVYPPECAPPIGATTTAAPENSTTLVPHYYGLLPIERCCPQVDDCKKSGGFCALNWLLETVLPNCDFKLKDVCKDYGCSCCIKCSQDKCSKCSETGGNCRKKCRSGELRDYFRKCTHNKCHCCKKCSMMDECREANGTCVANHYDCPGGTYASSGCCGGCYCCKPELQKLRACERKTGSYCSITEECAAGYYGCFGECQATQFVSGLQQFIVGYCCSPKVPVGGPPPPGRMGAFNYYVNKMVDKSVSDDQLFGGEIEPEQLNNIQEDFEKVIEDEIYDEVVPVEKKGQQYVESDSYEANDQGETDHIDNREVDENIKIQYEDKVLSPKFDSLIEEGSDTDPPIQEGSDTDSPIQVDSDTDAGVMAIDSPMSLDSPIDISDQVFYLPHQDDESNDDVEKTKQHHRRGSKKHNRAHKHTPVHQG